MNLDSTFSFDTEQLQAHFLPPVVEKKIPWLGKTWEQCAGLREVSAKLSQLPPGVEFPADFPEPIRFDAARGELRYRGFMSHTSFMELQKLNNSFQYGRALEAVFTASAVPAAPEAAKLSIAIWIAITVSILVIGAVIARFAF